MNSMNLVLQYLSELSLHNERPWFHENKALYQQANEIFLSFIEKLIHEIGKFDPSILGHAPKDLTFKLVRDTRFSHDKSPYLPAFRAHISSNGKLPIPVGYYLMIKPGDCSFLGGGLFADMFSNATTMVRDYICSHGNEWEQIITDPGFIKHFTLGGAKLKNVPRGYDKSHPQADYLKHKSWFIEYHVTDQQLVEPDFLNKAVEIFQAMQPFHRFLNKALFGFEFPAR